MDDATAGGTESGWGDGRRRYACRDWKYVEVPRRTASFRNQNARREGPRSQIGYARDARSRTLQPRVAVSGVESGRDMAKIFGAVDGVRTIIFPKMTRAVRQGAFCKVESLRSVVLNECLEALGTEECSPDGEKYGGVFQESGLERVAFPSTLKRIEYRAFLNCKRLKTARLPEGLESIGKSGFAGTGLESVEFPASLRTICQSAFCLCGSLRCAKFNEGLETLGSDEYPPAGSGFSQYYGVFSHSALERVELPSTLRQIEYGAFCGCGNLRSIDLPAGLERIGRHSFSETGLQDVVFPASLRTVAQGAFSGCRSLRTAALNEGLTALGTDACANNDEALDGVFQNSALESVTLPSTLRRVEYRAFADCGSLRAIRLPEGLERIGGLCFSSSGIEEIVLPPGVRTVSAGAFQGCGHLRGVQLNEGLEVLGEKWRCGRTELEGMAFAASGVESVRIPSTLRVVETQTFYGCKNLRSVEFAEGLRKIGVGAFQDSGVEGVVLPSSVRTVCAEAFCDCGCLRSVRLNEGLEALGQREATGGREHEGWVFAHSAVRDVFFPPTLRKIGAWSFKDCRELARAELPNGLECLGERCFCGSGVEEVALPSTLKRVGARVLEGCDRLATVWVEEGCAVNVGRLAGRRVQVLRK